VPPAVTVPRKPAAQIVHADTFAFPADAVEIADGHEVQLDAPAPA